MDVEQQLANAAGACSRALELLREHETIFNDVGYTGNAERIKPVVCVLERVAVDFRERQRAALRAKRESLRESIREIDAILIQMPGDRL